MIAGKRRWPNTVARRFLDVTAAAGRDQDFSGRRAAVAFDDRIDPDVMQFRQRL